MRRYPDEFRWEYGGAYINNSGERRYTAIDLIRINTDYIHAPLTFDAWVERGVQFIKPLTLKGK